MTHIIHASIYADCPEKAASNLAVLVDGIATPFHPLAGAWVCYLNEEDWRSALVEFYPKDQAINSNHGDLEFIKQTDPVSGNGTHFNLAVSSSRTILEQRCEQLGLLHHWRDWAGFVDIWLEPNLLIECVPEAA